MTFEEDPPSSVRSKVAHSHVSGKSRKSRKGGALDSKQKSSSDLTFDRKENRDIMNVTDNTNKTKMTTPAEPISEINFYEVDMPPPREIPEEEKILREKKEKELKLKALED